MRVRRKALVGGVLLVLFSALLLLLSTQGQQDGGASIPMEDPALEHELLELQERLRKSENQNRLREDELYALLSHMRGNSSGGALISRGNVSTRTDLEELSMSSLQVPGIHSYLPHLSGHPDRLRPALKISRGRQGVNIAIGLPTIKRDKASYLVKTLTSLIGALNQQESRDCVIVLFIAEPWDQNYVHQVVTTIKTNFMEHLESGLLEVISPPAGFYPDLNNLKETFGDPKERVKWRTKQNLDYAFLMLYARPKAMYYVQMEDDVIAKPGYLSIMKTFAVQQKGDWIMLEFSALGFIGKMFKASDVPMIVEFFVMFHADKPIDWLLDHLLWVKVCNPEKDVKHCQRMIQGVRRRFKPSLFQHIGVESSLKGKVQKLKDKDFGKAGLYRAHVNPPVHLASSLKTYQKYTLSKAYTGETFFWASNPSKGDIIDFKFDPPIIIEQYLFRSGNTDHPGDVFHNTTVELQVQTVPSSSVLDGIAAHSDLAASEVAHASDGFLAIGRFNDLGLAQGEIPESVGPVHTVRLHIHENSNAWVILSEIMIKESKR
ncbi:alpha-1,3-mannosyl-glycoprotein 4-beta-N-acetylglucosaminyltransferase A [Aplysia californica]|uniref:Alpha-1,3-mannosyl-glycoprotein 4-beta-N-acetylglucosaminyltransferase A n=1 Tax=Aplysia californica TaxID=6500 RepID=A0ABM0ZZS0_APLCA|nr:alpha-1,3-mannosyl-glycoprotein 4-beta-N-acetylglucosaminyltransferase A [Aplysia californica]